MEKIALSNHDESIAHVGMSLAVDRWSWFDLWATWLHILLATQIEGSIFTDLKYSKMLISDAIPVFGLSHLNLSQVTYICLTLVQKGYQLSNLKGLFTVPLAIAILKSDSLAIAMLAKEMAYPTHSLAKSLAKICLLPHGKAIAKEA